MTSLFKFWDGEETSSTAKSTQIFSKVAVEMTGDDGVFIETKELLSQTELKTESVALLSLATLKAISGVIGVLSLNLIGGGLTPLTKWTVELLLGKIILGTLTLLVCL